MDLDGKDLQKMIFLEKLQSKEGREAMKGIRAMLKFIGEDPDREGLLDTPKRVVKAMLELTHGLHEDPSTVLGTTFKEGIAYDEVVLVRDIAFTSLCEHHLLSFSGFASVGYLPNPKLGVVGLSKLARLVDIFARRPQVQERLTVQIADAIQEHLKPRGIIVRIASKHSCMSCRGIKKETADMVTQVLRGTFKNKPAARQEVSDLLNIPRFR
jgi:GTP cyclohydrolase I